MRVTAPGVGSWVRLQYGFLLKHAMVNGGLNLIWYRRYFFILSGIEHIVAYVLAGYGITNLS